MDNDDFEYSVKKPKQARALATVKLIFESTAQIILREGLEKLTTNRIAEVAGVSVGTLYQYFKNKESILLAMLNHEKDKFLLELDDLFAKSADLSLEPFVHNLIHFLLRRFSQRFQLRRSIVDVFFQQAQYTQLQPALLDVVNYLAEKLILLSVEANRPLSKTGGRLIAYCLFNAVRACTLEHSPFVQNDEFRNELARMVLGMMPTESDAGI